MAECGRLGPGGGWARILVAFVTGSFLAGCVSVETIKKREKESEGYYQQGLSVLDTDQQRAFVSFQKAIQANPNNYDARSEEHTSELQSRFDLVCRLLLE